MNLDQEDFYNKSKRRIRFHGNLHMLNKIIQWTYQLQSVIVALLKEFLHLLEAYHLLVYKETKVNRVKIKALYLAG